MSTSPRAGSVNSRASSSVTPGISPTVSGPRRVRRNLAVHLLQELVQPRPCTLRQRLPSGSPVGFEIRLMTSIRKPSTPRSSHQRIIA